MPIEEKPTGTEGGTAPETQVSGEVKNESDSSADMAELLFGNLGNDDFGGTEKEGEAPLEAGVIQTEAKGKVVPEIKPVVEGAPEAAGKIVEEPKPKAEAGTPARGSQQKVEATEGAKPKTIPELIQANRQVLRDKLASEMFQLPEDLAAELELEPATAVPKILADHYLHVMSGVYNLMDNVLPGLIQTYQSSSNHETEAQNALFSAFPALKEPALHPTVMQVGRMLRTQNPSMPREEFIQRLGTTVLAMSGQPVNGQKPVAKPSGRQARPFSPAQGAPASPGVAKQPQVSVFEELGMVMDHDFGD